MSDGFYETLLENAKEKYDFVMGFLEAKVPDERREWYVVGAEISFYNSLARLSSTLKNGGSAFTGFTDEEKDFMRGLSRYRKSAGNLPGFTEACEGDMDFSFLIDQSRRIYSWEIFNDHIFYSMICDGRLYGDSTEKIFEYVLDIYCSFLFLENRKADVIEKGLIMVRQGLIKSIKAAICQCNKEKAYETDSDGVYNWEKVNINYSLPSANDSINRIIRLREDYLAMRADSLEGLLEQLDNMPGLLSVKENVHEIIDIVRMNAERRKRNKTSESPSLHMVFTGNPGTGKTTVARLIAKIYQKLGVLSSGHLVEVDRSDLVGQYIGQSSLKTMDQIDKAYGGVLFIDEAYSLTSSGDDFGREVVACLLKAMEDRRDDFIVIVAGYSDLMRDFLKSNPGLKSRFNTFIDFPDYSPEEMLKIFEIMTEKNGYKATLACKKAVARKFEEYLDKPLINFGNGRDVRNLFEKIVQNQHHRLVRDNDNVRDITDEDLDSLTSEDVKEASFDGK